MISVVMPARNAGSTIKESIESVLASPAVRQLVVVNDGSTDETSQIVQSIVDERIDVISGPCKGISAAFNAGIEVATQKYIARCDADDLYPSSRLEKQLAWMQANSNYVAVTGYFCTIDAKGKLIATFNNNAVPEDISDLLSAGNTVTHFCTWLVRRDALVRCGGAREWFQSAEDIDLQFRLAEEGPVGYIHENFYLYRLNDSSITHTMTSSRREFFDQAARDFNNQRSENGEDLLMKGIPPDVPVGEGVNSARQHRSSLLLGEAWRLHNSGEYWKGLSYSFRAIKEVPSDVFLWKQLIKMVLKSLFRVNKRGL